jgi:hypothetical protein
MHVTQLASGAINGADQLVVELREPDHAPATVWLIWPAQPTICSPKQLNITVAAVMSILARQGVHSARPAQGQEAAVNGWL